MKQLFIFLIIGTLVWACGSGTETSNDTANAKTVAASDAPALDGKKIYKQYCVTCHGLYGDMGASGALNLQESILTPAEREVVIAKGRGVMTPFENLLDADEITAVATYTMELKK